MQIPRRFTQAGQDVYSTVEWTKRTSRITNADGSVVFEMADAEIPSQWSQLATDIMVSKYFRKAGVPLDNAETPKRQNVGHGCLPDADLPPRNHPHPIPLPVGEGVRPGPEKSARSR